MKKLGIIIATVALVVVGALAFASPKNEPANEPKNKPVPTNDYKDMWKKVKDNLEKNLPESAEKELNAIEEKASKDKNQVQLLKTYLYRQQIFQFTVEEDPAQHFIQYAEGKIGQLDEACNALLFSQPKPTTNTPPALGCNTILRRILRVFSWSSPSWEHP